MTSAVRDLLERHVASGTVPGAVATLGKAATLGKVALLTRPWVGFCDLGLLSPTVATRIDLLGRAGR
jgi:hypothetical protein